MPGIFLSHSSKDKALAKKIAEDLSLAGIDVWLDEWMVQVGDSISQKIQQGLRDMNLVAVLLTHSSIQSGWVEKEWQSKIGQEAERKRVLILPLKADDAEIPELLKDKKYADFASDYRGALDDLVIAIAVHSGEELEPSGTHAGSKVRDSLYQTLQETRAKADRLQKLAEGSKYFRYDPNAQELSRLNTRLRLIEQQLQLWNESSNFQTPKRESYSSSTLRFVTEGGKKAIFFSIANPQTGEPLILSSIAVKAQIGRSLFSGIERINLAEWVEGLDDAQRNFAAVNVSTGDFYVLSRKVIRIDSGEVVPFSLPLCCDHNDEPRACRVILRLISANGEFLLPSDCVYVLAREGERLYIDAAIPVTQLQYLPDKTLHNRGLEFSISDYLLQTDYKLDDLTYTDVRQHYKNLSHQTEHDSFRLLEFMAAIDRRSIHEVQQIIETGIDVNLKDQNGDTPLLKAARNGEREIVEILIKAKAKINATDADGRTAVAIAAGKGYDDMIMSLTSAGADLEVKDKKDNTPLIAAIKGGRIETVRALISAGASVDGMVPFRKPPLMLSVVQAGEIAGTRYSDDYVEIIHQLLRAGANVNQSYDQNFTALFFATHYGLAPVVRVLVQSGADVNARTLVGQTALSEAVSSGNIELVRFLIEAGADVNREIIEEDEIVFMQDKTVLMDAVAKGHAEIAQVLIDAGADVNARGEFGRTTLSFAVEGGQVETVRSLIKAGADVNAQDILDPQQTALMRAVSKGNIEIIETLLAAGADADVKDGRGNTV